MKVLKLYPFPPLFYHIQEKKKYILDLETANVFPE